MTDHTHDLAEALALTESMLLAAEAGDWDRFQEMDFERRQLVEGWVEQKDSVVFDPKQAHDCMEQMVALNIKIQKLAIAAKQQMMDDFKGFRRKRAGADAYSKCP